MHLTAAAWLLQDKYGGQLASIKTQDEYDALNHLITGNVAEQNVRFDIIARRFRAYSDGRPARPSPP